MSTGIGGLFPKSPFRLLDRHRAKVQECVALVRPMFDALQEEAYERLEKLTYDVYQSEHEADEIKNEIRKILAKRRIFLPVRREDLLGYLKLQDDIADSVEDVAVLLTLKRLTIPPALKDGLVTLVDKVLEACEHVDAVASRFGNLVGAIWGGPRVDEVLGFIAQAEQAESEADKLECALARNLFSHDDEVKPSELLLWSRILIEMGGLADHAKKTGDWLRRILAA